MLAFTCTFLSFSFTLPDVRFSGLLTTNCPETHGYLQERRWFIKGEIATNLEVRQSQPVALLQEREREEVEAVKRLTWYLPLPSLYKIPGSF